MCHLCPIPNPSVVSLRGCWDLLCYSKLISSCGTAELVSKEIRFPFGFTDLGSCCTAILLARELGNLVLIARMPFPSVLTEFAVANLPGGGDRVDRAGVNGLRRDHRGVGWGVGGHWGGDQKRGWRWRHLVCDCTKAVCCLNSGPGPNKNCPNARFPVYLTKVNWKITRQFGMYNLRLESVSLCRMSNDEPT